MKKHELDKLFSDKLNDYQHQPNETGWDKLEASLEQKSNKQMWAWLSIAASALLMAFSFWYMLADNTTIDNSVFTYSNYEVEEVDVPYEIVMVPVFIHVPATGSLVEIEPATKSSSAVNIEKNVNVIPKDIVRAPMAFANNNVVPNQLAIDMQFPKMIAEVQPKDPNINQTTAAMAQHNVDIHEPLTIIYKLGEPEPKSNFNKAINYVVEVRSGDKKLVNFKKIKENIRSKLKLNKQTNSI